MVRSNLLRGILLSIALLFTGLTAQAHEIRPTIADVEVSQTRITLSMRLAVEALVAGIDLSTVENANDAPEAVIFDRLRAMEPPQLEAAFREAWPRIALGFLIEVDGERLAPQIVSITIPSIGDVELARDSILVVGADLPPGDSGVRVGLDASFGQFVPRQIGGGAAAYQGFLEGGQLTPPLARSGPGADSIGTALLLYFSAGLRDMTAFGPDHALFAMGLFLFSVAPALLLRQVGTLAVALPIGLVLGVFGALALPAAIVEPLIALSLLYLGLDTALGWSGLRLRLAVVAGFGVIHGLGLWQSLDTFGIVPEFSGAAITGYGLGIIFGIVAMIVLAAALFGWAIPRAWYHRALVVPASLGIAAAGAFWMVERTLL